MDAAKLYIKLLVFHNVYDVGIQDRVDNQQIKRIEIIIVTK